MPPPPTLGGTATRRPLPPQPTNTSHHRSDPRGEAHDFRATSPVASPLRSPTAPAPPVNTQPPTTLPPFTAEPSHQSKIATFVRFRPPNTQNDPNVHCDLINYRIQQGVEPEYIDEMPSSARNRKDVLHIVRPSMSRVSVKNEQRSYPINKVFDTTATQADVFRSLWPSLEANLFNGLNATVVCYGQTGAGKTYTLFGSGPGARQGKEEEGVVQMSCRAAFDAAAQDEDLIVSTSFVEVYMDNVFDLLAQSPQPESARGAREPFGQGTPVKSVRPNSARGVSTPIRNTGPGTPDVKCVVHAQIPHTPNSRTNRRSPRPSQRWQDSPSRDQSGDTGAGGTRTTASKLRFLDAEHSYQRMVCGSTDDIMHIVEEGSRRRRTSQHELNTNSSRSHSVLFLYLTKLTPATAALRKSRIGDRFGPGFPEQPMTIEAYTQEYLLPRAPPTHQAWDQDTQRPPELWDWESKLTVVDLAGSERVRKTQCKGQQFKEAIAINSALSALSDVMKSLAEKKLVVFRRNLLTMALKEGLVNSFFALVCCCSPDRSNLDETLNTLQFGSVANRVSISRAVNVNTAARLPPPSNPQPAPADPTPPVQATQDQDSTLQDLAALLSGAGGKDLLGSQSGRNLLLQKIIEEGLKSTVSQLKPGGLDSSRSLSDSMSALGLSDPKPIEFSDKESSEEHQQSRELALLLEAKTAELESCCEELDSVKGELEGMKCMEEGIHRATAAAMAAAAGRDPEDILALLRNSSGPRGGAHPMSLGCSSHRDSSWRGEMDEAEAGRGHPAVPRLNLSLLRESPGTSRSRSPGPFGTASRQSSPPPLSGVPSVAYHGQGSNLALTSQRTASGSYRAVSETEGSFSTIRSSGSGSMMLSHPYHNQSHNSLSALSHRCPSSFSSCSEDSESRQQLVSAIADKEKVIEHLRTEIYAQQAEYQHQLNQIDQKYYEELSNRIEWTHDKSEGTPKGAPPPALEAFPTQHSQDLPAEVGQAKHDELSTPQRGRSPGLPTEIQQAEVFEVRSDERSGSAAPSPAPGRRPACPPYSPPRSARRSAQASAQESAFQSATGTPAHHQSLPFGSPPHAGASGLMSTCTLNSIMESNASPPSEWAQASDLEQPVAGEQEADFHHPNREAPEAGDLRKEKTKIISSTPPHQGPAPKGLFFRMLVQANPEHSPTEGGPRRAGELPLPPPMSPEVGNSEELSLVLSPQEPTSCKGQGHPHQETESNAASPCNLGLEFQRKFSLTQVADLSPMGRRIYKFVKEEFDAAEINESGVALRSPAFSLGAALSRVPPALASPSSRSYNPFGVPASEAPPSTSMDDDPSPTSSESPPAPMEEEPQVGSSPIRRASPSPPPPPEEVQGQNGGGVPDPRMKMFGLPQLSEPFLPTYGEHLGEPRSSTLSSFSCQTRDASPDASSGRGSLQHSTLPGLPSPSPRSTLGLGGEGFRSTEERDFPSRERYFKSVALTKCEQESGEEAEHAHTDHDHDHGAEGRSSRGSRGGRESASPIPPPPLNPLPSAPSSSPPYQPHQKANIAPGAHRSTSCTPPMPLTEATPAGQVPSRPRRTNSNRSPVGDRPTRRCHSADPTRAATPSPTTIHGVDGSDKLSHALLREKERNQLLGHQHHQHAKRLQEQMDSAYHTLQENKREQLLLAKENQRLERTVELQGRKTQGFHQQIAVREERFRTERERNAEIDRKLEHTQKELNLTRREVSTITKQRNTERQRLSRRLARRESELEALRHQLEQVKAQQHDSEPPHTRTRSPAPFNQ